MISSCGLSPIVHIDGTMVAAAGQQQRATFEGDELTVLKYYCTHWHQCGPRARAVTRVTETSDFAHDFQRVFSQPGAGSR